MRHASSVPRPGQGAACRDSAPARAERSHLMSGCVLQRPTLVLNRHWQPVHVAPVARALVMLWNEAACVIDPDDFPALYLVRLGQTRPPRGRAVHPDGEVPPPRPRGLGPDTSRPGAAPDRDVQPPQPLQTRSLHLPVLRMPARHRGADDRPRDPSLAGRPDYLGKLRARLRPLQRPQGQPNSRPGRHEALPRPGPPSWKPLYDASGVRIASWSRFLSDAYWNVPLEA